MKSNTAENSCQHATEETERIRGGDKRYCRRVRVKARFALSVSIVWLKTLTRHNSPTDILIVSQKGSTELPRTNCFLSVWKGYLHEAVLKMLKDVLDGLLWATDVDLLVRTMCMGVRRIKRNGRLSRQERARRNTEEHGFWKVNDVKRHLENNIWVAKEEELSKFFEVNSKPFTKCRVAVVLLCHSHYFLK